MYLAFIQHFPSRNLTCQCSTDFYFTCVQMTVVSLHVYALLLERKYIKLKFLICFVCIIYLFALPNLSLFRLAVLGKLNNFVKEWIAEISELKVGSVMMPDAFLNRRNSILCSMESFKLKTLKQLKACCYAVLRKNDNLTLLFMFLSAEPSTISYKLCRGQDIYIWFIPSWSAHKR